LGGLRHFYTVHLLSQKLYLLLSSAYKQRFFAMKQHLILLTFLATFAFSASAQDKSGNAAAPQNLVSSSDDATARDAVAKLTAKYQLSADQSKTMYGIQIRKLRNLTQIEPLKQSDPSMYRGKMQSIQKGTLNSIERLLNTQAQKDIFQQNKVAVRTQQAEKRKELTMQGASKEAIEDAMLEIYSE